MPLTLGSSRTSASTAGTSGPSAFIGTVTISMPKSASIEKCRSYPGTGQTKVTFSSCDHGRGGLGSPEEEQVGEDVPHQREAGVPAADHLLGLHPRAARRRSPAARPARRARRSCARPPRPGPGSSSGSSSSRSARSSWALEGLPRVRSSARPRALSAAYSCPPLLQERGEVGLAQVGQRGPGDGGRDGHGGSSFHRSAPAPGPGRGPLTGSRGPWRGPVCCPFGGGLPPCSGMPVKRYASGRVRSAARGPAQPGST